MGELKKENALQDFISMIKKSWTYAKLTNDEKENLNIAFSDLRVANALRGNYKQRWDILHSIYASFLYGVGYRNEVNWRSAGEELSF